MLETKNVDASELFEDTEEKELFEDDPDTLSEQALLEADADELYEAEDTEEETCDCGCCHDKKQDEEGIPIYQSTNPAFVNLPEENVIEITDIDAPTEICGKHIMLYDFFRLSDKLTLKDCFIEVCGGGFIGNSGSLEITDCEIVNPVYHFIHGRLYECLIKNTKFVFANFYPGRQTIDTDDEIRLEDCELVNLNPKYAKEKPEYDIPPFISAVGGTASGCTFKNFSSFTEIIFANLIGCTFESCDEVHALNALSKCNFTGNGSVISEAAKAESCSFKGKFRIFSSGDIIGCCFDGLCDLNDKEAILLRDASITDCTFSNITLSGKSPLCVIQGTGRVINCKRENISGEPLFVGRKKGGLFGLKTIEYNPEAEN